MQEIKLKETKQAPKVQQEAPKEEELKLVPVTEYNTKPVKGDSVYYEHYYNPTPWEWPDGSPRRHNFEPEQIDEVYEKFASNLDSKPSTKPEDYTPGYFYRSRDEEWSYYNGFYMEHENVFKPEGKLYSVPFFPTLPSLELFRRNVYINQKTAVNKISMRDFDDDEFMKNLLVTLYEAKTRRYYILLYYLSEMYDMTTGFTRHKEEEMRRKHQEAIAKYKAEHPQPKKEEPKREERSYDEEDRSATNIFGDMLNRLHREAQMDYQDEEQAREDLDYRYEQRSPEPPRRRMFDSGYREDPYYDYRPREEFYRDYQRPSREEMDYENQFRQGLRDAANGNIPLDDNEGYPGGWRRNDYVDLGSQLREEMRRDEGYRRPYRGTHTNARETFVRNVLRMKGLNDSQINEKLRRPAMPPRYEESYRREEDDEEFAPSKLTIRLSNGTEKHVTIGGYVPRYMYDYDINRRRFYAPLTKDLPVWRSPSEIEAMKRTAKFRDMSASEFFERFGEYEEAVAMGERRKQESNRLVNSYNHRAYKECMVGMSTQFPYSVNSGLEHLEIAMKTDQVAKLLERERIIRKYHLDNPEVVKKMGSETVTLNRAWLPYLKREIPFNDAKWTIEDKEAYRIQKYLYNKGMDDKDVDELIKNGTFTITPEMKAEGFIRQHYSVDYYTAEESKKILNSKEYKDYLQDLAKRTGMSAERIRDNSLKRRRFYENILRQHPELKARTYDKVYREDLL